MLVSASQAAIFLVLIPHFYWKSLTSYLRGTKYELKFSVEHLAYSLSILRRRTRLFDYNYLQVERMLLLITHIIFILVCFFFGDAAALLRESCTVSVQTFLLLPSI